MHAGAPDVPERKTPEPKNSQNAPTAEQLKKAIIGIVAKNKNLTMARLQKALPAYAISQSAAEEVVAHLKALGARTREVLQGPELPESRNQVFALLSDEFNLDHLDKKFVRRIIDISL